MLTRYKIKFLFFLSMVVLLYSGCKKEAANPNDNTDTNNPNVPMGNLRMHLHTYIGNTEVDGYKITYTTEAGRRISLNKAQLYISKMQMVKADGSLYNIEGAMNLQVLENTTYVIGKIPAGNYKGFQFYVGLDSLTNLKTPNNTAGDVLNTPSMWFGSTAQPEGYIFMHVDGTIDTDSAANGTAAQIKNFMYYIGTNANFKQVIMPENKLTVLANETSYLHLLTDYSKLFNNVNLDQSSNLVVMSKSENALPIAKQIVNNIPAMFRYEY